MWDNGALHGEKELAPFMTAYCNGAASNQDIRRQSTDGVLADSASRRGNLWMPGCLLERLGDVERCERDSQS